MDHNSKETERCELMRRIGAECAVLLRSDGSFPLDGPCELALYGSGARRTIKGGTGSGEVNTLRSVTVENGLEAAGFTLSTKTWLENYDYIYRAARKDFIRALKEDARRRHTLAVLDSMGAVMPEPEYNLPLNGAGDTAVYVLSRVSGEGSDRRAVPGDILLTETERRDILLCREKYKRFLLVLNVGGVVDLSPVSEVGNILLLSQLGTETGHVLADLLLGNSAPSGRLTATWSAWRDYPTIGDFGGRDDTCYREGVYVGYRYFNAAGRQPLFPFGFSLSYTTFAIKAHGLQAEGDAVSLRALVKNTGKRAGKEVVQLYVSPPDGRIDKPRQSLAAFAKTGELDPGGEQELTLSFRLRDLASYDTASAAWVLEKGDYILRIGSSSAETKPAGILRLDMSCVTRQVKNCCGRPGFEDWKPEAAPAAAPRFVKRVPISASSVPTETVNYELVHEIDPLVAAMPEEELVCLNIGAFDAKLGSFSVIGEASCSVAGAAGETTGRLRYKGVPSLVMADGPAGLRLSRQYTMDAKGAHPVGDAMPESLTELMPEASALLIRKLSGGKPEGELHEHDCTALPIGTAIAQSWNTELAERCGDIVGGEMERYGVHLWLAPALNIQRDIRCGRNFEYFSEDPLLSGKFAAALTRGVQKHTGRGATLKHFAANNQETNRYRSNSRLSERALREIYLRGFEIAVRESQPHALMTSYNLINGMHSAERRTLLEGILRAEFGFRGVVMTDWIIPFLTGGKGKYPAPDAARIAAAGNDLTMPGGNGDFKAMLRGLKDGKVTRTQLQINASRIVRLAKALAKNKRHGAEPRSIEGGR